MTTGLETPNRTLQGVNKTLSRAEIPRFPFSFPSIFSVSEDPGELHMTSRGCKPLDASIGHESVPLFPRCDRVSPAVIPFLNCLFFPLKCRPCKSLFSFSIFSLFTPCYCCRWIAQHEFYAESHYRLQQVSACSSLDHDVFGRCHSFVFCTHGYKDPHDQGVEG